ncbi:hypothetical protein Trydic_g11936 [Trypoxylus dichotomus]
MKRPLLLVLLVFLVNNYQTDCAPAVGKSTYQEISPKPGYIPVYIRDGNTPLEDINLNLAEAFDSYAHKHYKFDYSAINRRLKNGERHNEDNVILDKIHRSMNYLYLIIVKYTRLSSYRFYQFVCFRLVNISFGRGWCCYVLVLDHIEMGVKRIVSFLLPFFIIVVIQTTSAQQNAGRSVAPALQECYNNSELNQRDRRLPTSINVLIDLIRKAEDGRTAQDARQMAIELIHRFRQDGILRTPNVVNSQLFLPYSPRGFQAERNIIQLIHLIPGTAINFPNETLNALERCSLHHMLSSSIDNTQRGDEATVCNRLGRYVRRTRSVDTDVEQFDPFNIQIRSNLEEEPTPDEGNENVEEPAVEPEFPVPTDADAEILPSDPNQRVSTTLTTSDCPIEGGVIYTRWGAVSAGLVVAAIAAGLEPQIIQQGGHSIDSRFAVTLAGDLSEAALFQTGSTGGIQNIGAAGGWNSTLLPRWYFISETRFYEMTDADIRGGLDGLIIASNVRNWVDTFSTLKVSQILDMFYSRRGVFNDTMRACNRYNLLSTVAPLATLQVQTTGFSAKLDNSVTLAGTIQDSMIPTIASTAVNRFLAYTPTINDLSCEADTSNRNRVATDIIIVLDTQWPHNTIHSTIGYLLDNLDINRYGSTFTIINGNDGAVIVNTSSTILNYHQRFNLTVQQQHPTGFQYIRMFNEVEQMVRTRSNNDRDTGSLGLRSTIALFVPFQTAVTAEDNAFARERLEIHRSFIPDLNILILGGGARDSYNALVRNAVNDIFVLTDTTDSTNIVGVINPLVSRILEIPRRIINPHCGADFAGTAGTASLDDYVEPQTINFYRISPNFFMGDGNPILRIRGQAYGTFVACTSRLDSNPTQNSTATDLTCLAINANEEQFNLANFCNDGLIRDCNPVFLSIQSTLPNPNLRCADAGCRFPDNIKFTLSVENFSCRSGSAILTASFILISVLFSLLYL